MITNESRRRRTASAVAAMTAAATIGGGGLALVTATAAGAATCAAPTTPLAPGAADFDGDGVADGAYGEPTRRTAGNAQAGAVRIAHSCAIDTTLTAPSVGFASTPGSRFGATVTAAKIDTDAYTDLVVSAPGQNKIGVVVVVFGSADGLNKGKTAKRVTVPGLKSGDRFGEAVLLTTTYVNASGAPDLRRHLVVGAPGVNIGAATNAGAVFDLKLATDAATVDSSTRWVQGVAGVPGAAEKGDQFGEALSAGAVNAPSSPTHGATTVAIGVPHENVGKTVDAGAVFVVSGLGLDRVTSVSRSSAGVPGVARTGDNFGHAVLGVGNAFYVGTPGDDVGKAKEAGSVQRIKVDTAGTLRVSQPRTQNTAGVGGTAESGDHLGSSLTHVRVTDLPDGLRLVAGVPDEDVSGSRDAGAVTYLAFDSTCGNNCPTFTQNSRGYKGTAEAGDHFGASLTTVRNDAVDPLAGSSALIGVPGEDVNGRTDAGTLNGATFHSAITSGPSAGEHLGEVAPALFVVS